MTMTTLPPPRAALAHSAPAEFSRVELADLTAELRSECARVERTLAPGESSDELHALMQALQRLKDGVFGVCIVCERAIPLGRLQVMPATQTCVGCAR